MIQDASTPRDESPQPMTPERIAELRAIAGPPSKAFNLPIKGYALAVLECLDEIERLRDELDQIETMALSALTRPYEALRRIEEHAREALGANR